MEQQLVESIAVSAAALLVIGIIVLRGVLKSLNEERKAHDSARSQNRILNEQIVEKEAHIEALKTKVGSQRDEVAVLKHQLVEATKTISKALERHKIYSWQSTAVLVVVGLIAALLFYQIGQNRKMIGFKGE